MTETATFSESNSALLDPNTQEETPRLELRGVTKRFGGAAALLDVDFDLRQGEIHGLVGENGAGKSTMMKILSGVHSPDEGEMLANGEPAAFHSPADAQTKGIGMIYQELTMMPALSVAENVFLGRQPTNKVGLVSWGKMNRDASEQLSELGINMDVTSRLGSLSLGNQQLVEIARVVFSGADVIILDEPTSALSTPEAERLFALMNDLKSRGKSLIFISHFLEDVLAVSDRVTVLKNSKKVATLTNDGSLTKHKLIELMIGRDATNLAQTYEQGVKLPPVSDDVPMLELKGLSAPGVFGNIDLQVRNGEIVGIYGYLGSGMTEVARALFGQMKGLHGEIELGGETISPKRPYQAKHLGIAYLTENRRRTLFPRHEIYKNVTLAHLGELVKPVFRHTAEVGVADEMVQRTGVRPANSNLRAGQLSGGNQQKVVLAKWLTKKPKLLILNEPTRGMDVGAKREVLDLIRQLKEEGVAIILISTEPETVLAESDRIYVMSKGEITREFQNEYVTKDLLMSFA